MTPAELPGMWEAADFLGGQTDTAPECVAELVGAHCAAPYCECAHAVPVCVQTPTARFTHNGTRETGR